MSDQLSVAFVCLGNICRSPMAEAVFTHQVAELGYASRFKRIDSFGTAGYHVGDTPDHRSTATCTKHGVKVNHKAQQIKAADFKNFDFVIAMDEENKRNLLRLRPAGSKARVELFGKWNPNPEKFSSIVEDPYYGGLNGFEHNFEQVLLFSKTFLAQEAGQP